MYGKLGQRAQPGTQKAAGLRLEQAVENLLHRQCLCLRGSWFKCLLADGSTRKVQPDFVVFHDPETIIVIECKRTLHNNSYSQLRFEMEAVTKAFQRKALGILAYQAT